MTTGPHAFNEDVIAKPRGRLLRKYTLILAALVAGALVLAGAVQIWFSAGEHENARILLANSRG